MPLEDDDDRDEEDDTDPCPSCHRPVYEDAEQCPYCGHYLTEEESAGRPWWVYVGILVCLLVALSWAIYG